MTNIFKPVTGVSPPPTIPTPPPAPVAAPPPEMPDPFSPAVRAAKQKAQNDAGTRGRQSTVLTQRGMQTLAGGNYGSAKLG